MENITKPTNVDDVLYLNIIGGLLKLLNKDLEYTQQWSDTGEETLKMDFMFDLGSSNERFMQDNYTFFGPDCFSGRQKIDGNFDIMPRGALKLSSFSILSSNITNRFVRGTYNKTKNGKMETYSSYLYSIPISLRFDVEVFADSITTMMKIQQSVIETFYRAKNFYIQYKGIKVGCLAGFPDDYSLDKAMNYNYDAANNISMKFNILVESYHPTFDKTVETPIGNVIQGIGTNVFVNHKDNHNNKITLLSPSSNSVVFKESPLSIDWKYTSLNNDLSKIDISYILYKDGKEPEEFSICKGGDNHMMWLWLIPPSLSNYTQPILTYDIDPVECELFNEPVIKVIPDVKTGNITKESFCVMDGGLIILKDQTKDIVSIPISLSFIKGRKATKIPFGIVSVNIVNGSVDKNNPVTMTQPSNIGYIPDCSVIDIIIRDSACLEISAATKNITII